MGRQRNRPQMNEENCPEDQDEIDVNNLPDREFRVMVIKILNCMKRHRNHKRKDQSGKKNIISEINKTLEGIKSRSDEAEH